MRVNIFAALALLAFSSKASAIVINFSGTIDAQRIYGNLYQDYRFAETFTGTIDYNESAQSDKEVFPSVSVWIGDTYILRSPDFGQHRKFVTIGEHGLQYLDDFGYGVYTPLSGPSILNALEAIFLWPDDSAPLQRNSLDFSQVIGGSLYFCFDVFSPNGGLPAGWFRAGVDGTITNVTYATHATYTTSVPEPSTLALFGLGLLGVIGCRATRKRSASQ